MKYLIMNHKSVLIFFFFLVISSLVAQEKKVKTIEDYFEKGSKSYNSVYGGNLIGRLLHCSKVYIPINEIKPEWLDENGELVRERIPDDIQKKYIQKTNDMLFAMEITDDEIRKLNNFINDEGDWDNFLSGLGNHSKDLLSFGIYSIRKDFKLEELYKKAKKIGLENLSFEEQEILRIDAYNKKTRRLIDYGAYSALYELGDFIGKALVLFGQLSMIALIVFLIIKISKKKSK